MGHSSNIADVSQGYNLREHGLAEWLFEQVRVKFCDNCPKHPIPPLYLALARSIISQRQGFLSFLDALHV